MRGREKEKEERGKDNIFHVFRRSELDCPRTKVGLHNESYTYLRVINGHMVQPKQKTEFSDIGIVFRTTHDWVLKVGIRAGFSSGTV